MRDMEYLTKEDLPYFEQLEKEGRAVIIRLDQTKLKDLDIDRFLEAHPDEIRQEELLSFLKENKAVLDEAAAKEMALIMENKALQDYLDREEKRNKATLPDEREAVGELLTAMDGTTEEMTLIREAVENGFTDDELRILFNSKATGEEKRQLYKAMLYRRI